MMDTRDGRYGCTCPGCLMDTVRAVQDMPDQYDKGYAQAIEDAAKYLLSDGVRNSKLIPKRQVELANEIKALLSRGSR